jgi:hypothetical protein
VRFTRRAADDGTIYAVFLGPLAAGPVTIKDLRVAESATARDVATKQPVALRRDGDDLTLTSSGPPPSVPAHAVAIYQGKAN